MHGHPCTGVQQRRRFAMHLTPAIIRLWMGKVRPPDGSIKGTRLSWHLPSSQPWEPTERRQQQFRQLHSFPSTLIERSVLIFACLSLSSHVISLSGPPPSLILITIAPKSYGTKYYCTVPSPLRLYPEEPRSVITLCAVPLQHETLFWGKQPMLTVINTAKVTSQVAWALAFNNLSSMALRHQVANPVAAEQLQTLKQGNSQLPENNTTRWKGAVVWCCLRNSSRDNRTHLVQGKFSHWNISQLVQRPSITFPPRTPETSPFCFHCPCSSETKWSLHT